MNEQAFTTALLITQRDQLRMLLLTLPLIDEQHRTRVKAGALQALGAVEDALGCERTHLSRNERHQERWRDGKIASDQA